MRALIKLLSGCLENCKDAAILGPSFPLRHIAAMLNKNYTFRLSSGESILLRSRTSDASTIRQVFRNKEYCLKSFPQWPDILQSYDRIIASGNIPVIIDAGANIGAAAIWFSRVFPEARVFAIEPEPSNAEQCQRNTSSLLNVVVVEKAIGATAGRVALRSADVEAWAVQTDRASDDSKGVQICTIPEILSTVSRGELFIAKIDIEGFESDLFASCTDWVKMAKVIFIEPHDWMPTARRTSQHFQAVLGALGAEILISGENLVFVRTN